MFVLHSILSDVTATTKKEAVDINVLDLKQTFDAEEVPNVLNALYEAGIKYDMLAMLNAANELVQFAVNTPNGMTEIRSISNKIMQGDVMAPLMSSNFVDVNIVRSAVKSGNIYMYTEKVPFPPLIMQDDTITISAYVIKTQDMNTMINTCANIMGLQFGSEKCVKMHIGKKHNPEKCGKGRVDSWKEVVIKNKNGEDILFDHQNNKVDMKTVGKKKYLGQIISNDLKNEKNLKDKTNKSVGNVNKIITTLQERLFGIYNFKAAMLMRDGILMSALLNNAETWNNITKKNTLNLEKPDTMLQQKLFDIKSSKVFYYLELGILPGKYVIMKKRLKFLKYILDEPMETMIRKVFEEQRKETQKGDFINQVSNDF